VALLALALVLALPWALVLYSLYVEEPLPFPPNRCVELVREKLEERALARLKLAEPVRGLELTLAEPPAPELKKPEKGPSRPKRVVKKRAEHEPAVRLLVVGDSLGEGLYLAYARSLARELKSCLKVRFFVRHSTTTRWWSRHGGFLSELKRGRYDALIVVLGANEWATDAVTLRYNVKRFCKKVKGLRPDLPVYWVVPPTGNERLREFVEECVGPERAVAIEDYLEYIPMSRDRVHPDLRRGGYERLWDVILRRLLTGRALACGS